MAYTNNNGQVRIGVRSGITNSPIAQPAFSASLLQSLYGVWNGDTTTNELDKSLFGVWNAENSTNTLDNSVYSVFTDLTTYTNTGLTNSQTGLWDAEGLGLNDKVGTNHLTSFGSATFSTDTILGTKSFTFTNATQYFGLPINSWNFTGDFSVSFWAKATWGNSCIPISNRVWIQTTPTIKYSGWQIGFNGAKPYFYGDSGGTASFSVSSAVDCVSNSWSNVVVTKSNNVVSIYVNGFLGGTSSVTGNITYATTSYPSIGAQKYSSTGVSDHAGLHAPGCKFDNISTWTRVLSHDDVIALYNSGSGQSYPYTQPVTISVDKSQSLTGFVVGTGSSVVSGKTGNAISLTQSTSIILKDISAMRFTGDFSVSFWFKTPDVTTGKALISRHDGQRGWYVYIAGGNILWGSGGSVVVAFGFNSTTLVANTWYHVAVSLTNNVDVKCYLNGVLGGQQSMVSKTITYDYWTSYHPVVIGGRANNNGSTIYMDLPFNGIIDDMVVWTRPITQNEVNQLYNGTTGVEYPYSGKLLSSPNDNFGTNHGTLMNGCTFTTGISGNAFSFDGVNDYLQFPNTSMRFTGDFSISCFVYFNSLSTFNDIFGNYYGINVSNRYGFALYQQSNKIKFATYNVSTAITVGSTTLATGQWYHIIVTKTSNNIPKIYLNGVLETMTNGGGAIPQSLNPAYDANLNIPKLGAEYENGVWSGYLNGKIDAFSTWTKELSQDEVTQLYNSGTGAQYPFTGTFSSAINQLGVDNGTLMNGCYLSNGKIGKAFTFDGINDFVLLPTNSMRFTGDFSYSFFVSLGNTSGDQTIVSCENYLSNENGDRGYLIYFTNGVLKFGGYYNSSVIVSSLSTTTVTANTWNHFVVTKTSSQVKIYMNGVLQTTTNYTGIITYNSVVYPSIGVTYKQNNVNNNNYHYISAGSKIDALTAYQKELTQSEVTELYNSGNGKQITTTPIVQSGLVLNLDASRSSSYTGTGSTWTDISGNANNGTLTNGPVFGTASGGVITFDGVNDYIDMGINTAYNLTNISVSVWVKLSTGTPGYSPIISRYSSGVNNLQGWVISYATSTSKFKVEGRENSSVYLSFPSTNTYSINNWYNVTWTKSASTWSLYINGVLDRTATIGNGTTAYLSNNMQIGGSHESVIADRWYGKQDIGGAQIYNRSLSATEVLQNFNATKSRFGY